MLAGLMCRGPRNCFYPRSLVFVHCHAKLVYEHLHHVGLCGFSVMAISTNQHCTMQVQVSGSPGLYVGCSVGSLHHSPVLLIAECHSFKGATEASGSGIFSRTRSIASMHLIKHACRHPRTPPDLQPQHM